MRSLLIASAAAIALAGCSVAIEERYLLFPWSQKLPPLADDVTRRNVEVPAGGGVVRVMARWLFRILSDAMGPGRDREAGHRVGGPDVRARPARRRPPAGRASLDAELLDPVA